MATFKFELGALASISINGVSGETGEIIARAEYTNAENMYFLRYIAADGRAVQQWWTESALVAP